MDRLFSVRSIPFLLAGLLTFGMVACGGGDDDDDSATAAPTATPEPTPTPTPTPVPLDDTFRVTSMEIAAEGEGADIDGDGSPDNAIYDAMDGLVQTSLDSIEAALIENEVPDDALQAIMVVLNQALQGIFNVDNFSAALDDPIQNLDVHYVWEFLAQVDGSVGLNWYEGDMQGSGQIKVDTSDERQVLGNQVGSFDETGKTGSFQGDISITFIFNTPDITIPDGPPEAPTSASVIAPTEEINLKLVLAGGVTEVANYNSETLREAMFAGAIIIEDIVSFIESIINLINDALGENGLTAQEVTAIVDEIEAGMSQYSDVKIDGKDGFSISVNVSADEALVEIL